MAFKSKYPESAKPMRSKDDYDAYGPPGNLTLLEKELFKAAEKNDVAEAKKLIAKGASVNAADGVGQTALFYACWKGQLEVAELLLNHPKINCMDRPDKWHNTALHYASCCGHLPLVELLVQKGANLQLVDKAPGYGLNALQYAKKYHRAKVAKFLEPLMAQAAEPELLLNELQIEDEQPSSSQDEQVLGFR